MAHPAIDRRRFLRAVDGTTMALPAAVGAAERSYEAIHELRG